MSEVALYRKYRPKTFKDVLGQEHVVGVLEGAIAQGNVTHAYLFSGSRGTGKTSIARIFARAVGCTDKDMYEIDAASTRGIDDIRELRDAVHVLPFESPYKVYIIDEVHMLTKEAFNALLKTLEEPPPHALFILATTEPEKLPETIISRCQSFSFKKPSATILKEMIRSVAKKEGLTIDAPSADLIALLAEGSYRDAHGILQKVIVSSKDKKVSLAEVEAVTGAPKGTLVNAVITAIEENNLDGALEAVGKAVGENIDIKVFLKLILQKIRSVLLLKYSPGMLQQIEEQYSREDFAYLKELSEKKDTHVNSFVLSELLEAYMATGRAHIPQLPLELALIKLLNSQS